MTKRKRPRKVVELLEKYNIIDGTEGCSEQRSIEWHKRRYNMISSSNASAVIGSNKYLSRNELFKQKTKTFDEYIEMIRLRESKDVPAPIKWGVKYEPIAKIIYEKISGGIPVEEVGIVPHPNIYWLGASPDGIRVDGRLLEIKCLWNRKNSDKIEILPYIWIQMQIQMEVTGFDSCDLIECKFIEYDSRDD